MIWYKLSFSWPSAEKHPDSREVLKNNFFYNDMFVVFSIVCKKFNKYAAPFEQNLSWISQIGTSGLRLAREGSQNVVHHSFSLNFSRRSHHFVQKQVVFYNKPLFFRSKIFSSRGSEKIHRISAHRVNKWSINKMFFTISTNGTSGLLHHCRQFPRMENWNYISTNGSLKFISTNGELKLHFHGRIIEIHFHDRLLVLLCFRVSSNGARKLICMSVSWYCWPFVFLRTVSRKYIPWAFRGIIVFRPEVFYFFHRFGTKFKILKAFSFIWYTICPNGVNICCCVPFVRKY